MITDNKTVYEDGKYRLNEDYVLNDMGTDLRMIAYDEFDANPSTLPERILKETSDIVYDYMQVNCKDYYYACELIRTDQDMHNRFIRALEHQLNAFIIKGDTALNGGEKIASRAYDSIVGLLFKRRPPSFKISGRYEK
jgi:hypothetical protein